MHPASAFRSKDEAFRDRVIAETGFATIFMTTPDGPRAGHTPVEWADGALTFHLARSNALTPHLDGARALAVIQGPDAYVSARWYEAANQVPTWNYVAYEIEGEVSRLPDTELPALLERLSNHHEGRIRDGKPWWMDKLDRKTLDSLLRGIVGFKIRADTIGETVKLSQNKPAETRKALADGLASEGKDALARLMRETIA